MNPTLTSLRASQVGFSTSIGIAVLCAGLHAFGTSKIEPGPNIIANGDFRSKDPERRPLRWVSDRGPQTALVTRSEHHGVEKDDSSLEVAAALASPPVLVRSEKHIANPGTLYVASAWGKTTNSALAALHLEFWSQNGVRIGVASATPSLTAEWQ